MGNHNHGLHNQKESRPKRGEGERPDMLVTDHAALPSSPVSELVEKIMAYIEDIMVEAEVDYPAGYDAGARVSYDSDEIQEFITTTLSTRNADLEREVKRLREAQQWQPIETAPQSVDILVGGYLNDEWKCSVYRIRDEFWREDWDAEPTHWQPLSISPQGGEHE